MYCLIPTRDTCKYKIAQTLDFKRWANHLIFVVDSEHFQKYLDSIVKEKRKKERNGLTNFHVKQTRVQLSISIYAFLVKQLLQLVPNALLIGIAKEKKQRIVQNPFHEFQKL